MKRTLLLLVTLVLIAAGCGSDDEPLATGDGSGDPAGDDGPAGDDDRDTIDGEYVSVQITEAGEPLALFEGTEVSLQLDDGRLSMQGDCNSLGTSYSIDDGVLTTGGVDQTEIGCPEPGHDQDRWLGDFISAGPAIEAVEEGLVLTAGDRSIEFVDESVADPDRELVGTTWELTGFIHGSGPDSAVSSPAGDAGFVVFEENGFVTGHDGCNRVFYAEDAAPDEARSDLGKTYTVEEDRVRFEGGFVSTFKGCADEDGPQRFRAVLTGTATYEIDGSKLTLRAEDGTGVTYRAADQ